MLAPWKESYDKLGQPIQKQRHHFANEGPYIQSYDFPVVMYRCWELDYEKRLSAKVLMSLNCGAGEDSWESLRL